MLSIAWFSQYTVTLPMKVLLAFLIRVPRTLNIYGKEIFPVTNTLRNCNSHGYFSCGEFKVPPQRGRGGGGCHLSRVPNVILVHVLQ